jgi:hypothetical protein
MRVSRFLLVASALGWLVAIGVAPSALAGAWSHSDSACKRIEDPANWRAPNMYAREFYPGGNFFYDPTYTPWAARDIAQLYWAGGLGSSDSYYLFQSTNGGCQNQASYATSSILSGWHIRFWIGTTSPVLFGAAHHDFWCSSTSSHSSDKYINAAKDMARNFYNWSDYDGDKDFSRSSVYERAPSSGVHCGRTWADDGYTWVDTQLPTEITTIFAG